MGNRAHRGSAAARYAARQTEEIEVSEDDEEIVIDEPDGDDEPEIVIDEPDPDPADNLPDYSHEEDPEPEPKAEPDALEVLQARLSDLQTQNAALEQQARQGEAATLTSQRTLILSGLREAQGDLETAKAEYAVHAKAGDFVKVAEAQAKITEATIAIGQLKEGHEEIKAAIETFNKRPKAQPAAAADPFEAAIVGMSEPAKVWCRKNKADLTKSMVRSETAKVGHLAALEAGVTPDTPEYFAFLDKHMGYGAAPMPKNTKPGAALKRPVGQPRVAAPGGGRAAPVKGANDVSLSRAEVNMAKAMGVSLKEYAANKAEIIKNGRDPSRGGLQYSANTAHSRR